MALVCLACFLGSTDTTAHIHYYRPDVREFSNRPGKPNNGGKSEYIIVYKDESTNHRSTHQIPSNPEYHLFILSHILNKYIDLDKYLKILRPPGENTYVSFMNRNNLFINQQENISSPTGNGLPFQALKIVATSIIRS